MKRTRNIHKNYKFNLIEIARYASNNNFIYKLNFSATNIEHDIE